MKIKAIYLACCCLFSTLHNVSSKTSDKVLCKWQYPKSLMNSYLCLVTRQIVKQAPAGTYLLDVVDHFFGGKDPTAWDLIKKDVEKHVASKFDDYTIRTLNQWKNSMSSRVQSCKLKIDQNIKISCYKNLQEDLAGYEAIFRGSNLKEISMSLEYYDIYVATFMAVSNHLRNISGPALQKSIDRDIQHKAKIFSDYLQKAVDHTQGFLCRHIKIKVEEEYLFWKEERLIWPNDEDINKYLNPKLRYNDIRNEMENTTHQCRMWDTINTYASYIIDVRNGSKYPGGGYHGNFCRDAKAMPILIPLTHPNWRTFVRMCITDDDKQWLRHVQERLNALKEIMKPQQAF